MRILVDENIPFATVRRLAGLGYEVRDLRGGALQGIPDSQVKDLADREDRVLITTDAGFLGNPPSSGLLVVRLKAPNSNRIDAAVERGLKRVAPGHWRGKALEIRDFSIIERRRR